MVPVQTAKLLLKSWVSIGSSFRLGSVANLKAPLQEVPVNSATILPRETSI